MSANTGTLDANSETFTVTVSPGQRAKVRMLISGTITVTATDGDSAFTLPSGGAAAWTTSDSVMIEAPGLYTFTASGVSGGTCDYQTTVWGQIS